MERSTGGAMPKTFSKNVLLLKNSDFQRINGQACMPTASELSTIKKTVELGQFKKDVVFEASMSEDGIKNKLEEIFPYLNNKRFSCAAVVKLSQYSSRFEFDGYPRLWSGKKIRSKIKGNSALYILEDETSLVDDTEMEIDESQQGATPGYPDDIHASSTVVTVNQVNGEHLVQTQFPTAVISEGGNVAMQNVNSTIHWDQQMPDSTDVFSSDENATTSGISAGSDPGYSEEEFRSLLRGLEDTDGVEVNIDPKESPLEGGLFCKFTFNPELHPDVTSGRATFGNLGTIELERLRNGSLLGTIPASPVPGLVPVILFSQVGTCLGQTELKYFGMEELLRQIVTCPDYMKTIFEEYNKSDNPESSGGGAQNSGTLGFTQPVPLLRALVYTAAKVGAQQFIEMIFTSSAGKVVFRAYKDSPTLPEVIARDHGNKKVANYLEDITKRFSEEIRTGQECSQMINWSELVKAAEQLGRTSEEENYQLERDISKDTGYLGDVETSSNESSELESSDSEDDTPSTFSKADTVGQQDEIQLESNLEDHNEDTKDQHEAEIKLFADIVSQEDEIQLERNLLEDHNEDTIDQHEVEIKPFAETVGQQDEIHQERNLLEDYKEDTNDQHEVEIKPFAADTVEIQDEIQLERNLEDHNEGTKDQHEVEIKPFADGIQLERNLLEDHNEDTKDGQEVEIKPLAAGTVFQEDEIQLEINRLEDHSEDTKDQHEDEIKPFAEASLAEPFDVKTCRSKLAEHYKRTAKVPTSVWSKTSQVDIHQIYTPLSWVKEEQTPAGSSQSELTHYTDVFTANKNGDASKRILVQGQTGIGKSTFVNKLAVDWAELNEEKSEDKQGDAWRGFEDDADMSEDNEIAIPDDEDTASEDQDASSDEYKVKNALKKFELAIVINLKEVSNCQSLRDVISHCNIFPEAEKALTEGLLSYISKNQEKVLLVFDGYDEYRCGSNSEIYKIFRGTKLRNCCVLITTQISKADELQEFKDVHAEITGFSREDREEVEIKPFAAGTVGQMEGNLLHDHNDDTKGQHEVEIKPFAEAVGQEDEIQLERNLLEDHSDDTKDQHEVEIKPFASNLAS